MPKWIWQGGPGDPPLLEWCGVVFPAGVPVEVNHPHLLAKMPGNPFFREMVERRGRPKKAALPDDPDPGH